MRGESMSQHQYLSLLNQRTPPVVARLGEFVDPHESELGGEANSLLIMSLVTDARTGV